MMLMGEKEGTGITTWKRGHAVYSKGAKGANDKTN
jgi:hypothetical protein